MKAGLVLKEVRPGVHRWASVEQVLPPHAEHAHHAQILARHAQAYDALARRQRERGDVDEAGLAQAKEDHLDVVHHMLGNLPPAEAERLGRLRVMPWDGHNDTLYNPHHHAVFLGSETVAGGHARYGRFGHMVAHELAHAVDHDGNDSRLGRELKAKLTRAEVPHSLIPPRLRVALHDHHEWAPRLLELALSDPERFAALHRSLKASHDIDLRGLMKSHLGVQVPVHRRTQKEMKKVKS